MVDKSSVYVFGYGSLMSPTSVRRSCPTLRSMHPALLRGYTRAFSLVSVKRLTNAISEARVAAYDTVVARGKPMTPDELDNAVAEEVAAATQAIWDTPEVAAVAIRPMSDAAHERRHAAAARHGLSASTHAPVNGVYGVLLEIPAYELPAYKKREHRYEFLEVDVEVTGSRASVPPPERQGGSEPAGIDAGVALETGAVVKAIVCVESDDETYRAGFSSAEEYHEVVGKLYDGQLWGRKDILPQRRYVKMVANAAAELSGEAAINFIAHTLIADSSPLWRYVQKHLDRFPLWEPAEDAVAEAAALAFAADDDDDDDDAKPLGSVPGTVGWSAPLFVFVGVSTAKSMIHTVLPAWCSHLSLPPLRLIGVDLPVDTDAGAAAATVDDDGKSGDVAAAAKGDRLSYGQRLRDVLHFVTHHSRRDVAGCLITTHKQRAWRECRHFFHEFDTAATVCQELSASVKPRGGPRSSLGDGHRGAAVIGAALDLEATRRSLNGMCARALDGDARAAHLRETEALARATGAIGPELDADFVGGAAAAAALGDTSAGATASPAAVAEVAWAQEYWALHPEAEVLVLGCGGSGTAILIHLLTGLAADNGDALGKEDASNFGSRRIDADVAGSGYIAGAGNMTASESKEAAAVSGSGAASPRTHGRATGAGVRADAHRRKGHGKPHKESDPLLGLVDSVDPSTGTPWRRRSQALATHNAGDAGAVAAALTFQPAERRPARIHMVDVSAQQVDALRDRMHAVGCFTDVSDSVAFSVHAHGPAGQAEIDNILECLPPHSLIVNATGMGKDLPGSPISDAAEFPMGAIVWELNYRGPRLFLEQARRQQFGRHLNVHSGLDCFLHGWTAVLEATFDIVLSEEQRAELFTVAAAAAPMAHADSSRGAATSTGPSGADEAKSEAAPQNKSQNKPVRQRRRSKAGRGGGASVVVSEPVASSGSAAGVGNADTSKDERK